MGKPLKEDVMLFYSERASEWPELMAREKIRRVRNEEVKFIQTHLNLILKGSKILDIGIGAGVHERVLYNRAGDLLNGLSWTGIDIVPAMLNEGKRAGLQIDFRLVDVNHLTSEFEQSSFDAMISQHVFSLIPDEELQGVLNNIGFALKPNGLLIGCVYTPPNDNSYPVFPNRYPQYKDKTLRDAEMGLNQWRPFSFYGDKLKQAGFEITAKLPLTYDAVQFCSVKI